LFEDKNNYFVNTAKNIFKNLPIENVIFFNEKSALIHSKRFSKDYSKSTITPIGIATENLEYLPLVNKSNKVISIGRLTPFKTYNSCMIDAIARLKTKGIILNYEIYGTGECEKSLKDKIQQLDLQDQVQLKGDISYDRIKEVLNGALAFVGSGTALIEASAAGVPSIIGIEHATDSATYGFLHSTSGLSYHDAGLGYPLTTFDSCLQALVEGSNSDLAIHSNLAKNRAKDFSIERTTKDFLNLSARATTIKNPIHLNVIDCLKINASMINLRLLASCGKARFFDRHSNVTSS
jgi:1,2-diacylglycerol 3-alpha-glucosyltransferase